MSYRNVHHKWARSRGGPTNRWNCCKVNSKLHMYWHAMFGNLTGEEIAREINSRWLDPRFELIVIPRKDR